ncbi:MAG: transposase [Lentisphaeria bacterium]|jgi:putative transposase
MSPTPQRNCRSIRLQGYDYSQAGAYFVTICTHNRACLFGEIVSGEMRLNDAGNIACQCWDDIPVHFPNVDLDEFVVMPNHLHGIIVIADIVGATPQYCPPAPPPPVGAKNISPLPPPRGTSKTVGSIVRGFKIGVTKWMRSNTSIYEVWQRNYWEHIVRNEPELNRIRKYIHDNPAQWELDRLHSSSQHGHVTGAKNLSPPPSDEIWEPTAGYGMEIWMV